MTQKAKFENSLACIEYWPTNPYHPVIKPILDTIKEFDNDFKYITGIWAYPDDFKKANNCLLQFENYLIYKLGTQYFKKNYKVIKSFLNSRSWKSLPFEVNSNDETIYFHHSIPLRIPSKWNIFQFEDLLSLYIPYFHAGIVKRDLIERKKEFKIISTILKAYFEHPSIISIVTHYEQAKKDFTKFIGGEGIKKIKVIEPFIENKSIISLINDKNINHETSNLDVIRILFTGSHHGNPGNLLSRGIQYTFKFALELSKLLIEKNIDSKVELILVAPSQSRIEDYISSEGLLKFKKEIKRVSGINYGEKNPNPKLKINYVVNRISNDEMSLLKNSTNLYPDFAATVHTSSIFEAFSSKTLYLGLRKKLISEFTDNLHSNEQGLFIQNSSSSDWPSSITAGMEEEENIYGANLERISDLALNVLKTLSNKKVLDEILYQQSIIFQKTNYNASLKWNLHIDEVSKSEKYNKLFKDYFEKQSLGDLFANKRAAKIQTLFYRSMYLEMRKNTNPKTLHLLHKFKFNTNKITNYSSYPDSKFSETTYKITKFDLIIKAHVNTNLTESNAQLRDIFYIVLDIIKKTKSICIENSNHIETYCINDTYIANYYLNFLGLKKIKFTLIDSFKHTIKLKLIKYKSYIFNFKNNIKKIIMNIYRGTGNKVKYYLISLISFIFRL